MPAPADVASGVVLDGRYRLDDVLGHGGMATVYRARDQLLERDVAVKLFPSTPDADEALRHRSEMRVLARLSHPNLVTLYDAGAADVGHPSRQTYLVMELVPGPTLADLLVAGPLPTDRVARIGHQLAEALLAAHDAGVVHRDVKPANVLLVAPTVPAPGEPDAPPVTGPVVKLADFGIARVAGAARLTMTGTTLGTAAYLSPEQAAGGEVGPSTDVYALGLVLLECLSGEKAFTGTVVEVAAARLTASPPVPPGLGERWTSLLRGMTARVEAERLTMAEAAQRLAELAADGDVVAVGRPARRPPRTGGTAIERATRGPAAPPPPLPPDGLDTRPLRTGDIVARARAGRPAEAGPGRRGPAAARGLLALLALVLALVVVGVPATEPQAPSRPAYPAVEGPLGAALDDLARSVDP